MEEGWSWGKNHREADIRSEVPSFVQYTKVSWLSLLHFDSQSSLSDCRLVYLNYRWFKGRMISYYLCACTLEPATVHCYKRNLKKNTAVTLEEPTFGCDRHAILSQLPTARVIPPHPLPPLYTPHRSLAVSKACSACGTGDSRVGRSRGGLGLRSPTADTRAHCAVLTHHPNRAESNPKGNFAINIAKNKKNPTKPTAK